MTACSLCSFASPGTSTETIRASKTSQTLFGRSVHGTTSFHSNRIRSRSKFWREASFWRRHSNEGEAVEEIEYNDSLTDVAFIALCRKAYGNLAGWQSSRDWWNGDETYKGMVEVSRALMKGRSPEEQRAAIIEGFPEVPDWFRKLFPYSKWGAELNAKITPAFFKWLVGPMESVEVEINGEKMNSGVHIKQCRYLKESGCVGMCVNLCKAPCQTFFTEQLGMPLTMNPNFEDYSCEMIFGEKPLPLDDDPVMEQGCLPDCPSKKETSPCWTMRSP